MPITRMTSPSPMWARADWRSRAVAPSVPLKLIKQANAQPPRAPAKAVTASRGPSLQAPVREAMRTDDRVWLNRPGLQVVHWLVQLEGRMQPAALVSHIETRRAHLPHFDQRIGRTARGVPCWETVPQWQASQHVRAVCVRADAVADTVAELSQKPLPADAPPWEIVLVQAPKQGTLLLLRTHHAMADGRSLVEALLALHDDAEEGQRIGRELPAPRTYTGSPNGPLIDGAEAVRDTFATMTHLLMGPGERASPIKGAEGSAKTQAQAWLEPWALADVKATAHAYGGTINDLLITAITGGLRRYLQAHGQDPETADLHALQIIAMGGKRSLSGGNTVTAVSTHLPIKMADVESRFAAVRRLMKSLKQSWQPEMMQHAQHLAVSLPDPVQQALYRRSADQHSIIVSNVQGSRVPLRIAGHTVSDMRWFGPTFGSVAVRFSALSYAGRFTLGISTDAAVIEDAPGLKLAMAEAWTELVEQAARIKR